MVEQEDSKRPTAKASQFPLVLSLQATLDAMPNPVVITDTDPSPVGQRIVFANQAFCRLSGRSAHEVIGRAPDLFSRIGEDWGRADLQQALAEGSHKSGYLRYETRRGETVDLGWTLAPIFSDRGVATHLLLTLRETRSWTAPVSGQGKVRHLFELAFAGGDLGLWDWNVETDELLLNERWSTLLGYDPSEISPNYLGWESLVHPEDLASARASIERHLQGQSDRYEAEFRMRTKSGDWRWMLSRGKIVEYAAGGRPIRFVGIHLDTTDRRDAETILRRANEDLQHFAYIVSHDLQTPLRTMAAYAELLSKRAGGELNTDSQILLARIQQGARQASREVQDLLVYARAGAEDQELDKYCPLDIALDNAIHLQSEEIRSLHAVVEREPLPCVRCNASQIQHLFFNLIDNALKFRRPGQAPKIRVEARLVAPHWRIGVHDEGIGLDPSDTSAIFSAFRRLDGHEQPGSGLGLAICKRIVERHGGKIWAEARSDVGGTSFYFLLPAAHIEAASR